MNKKILLSIVFLLSVFFLSPITLRATDFSKTPTKPISFITKIQEKLQYFFAFGADKKVQVLEKQAEKRLNTAQSYAENGNNQEVKNQLQDYLQTKEKQTTLLGKVTDNKDTLGAVENRTIEQQKTMEKLKTQVADQEIKQEVIQTQEQVVNQVAKKIIDTNGTEGATEFFQKVEHVWAPGTGPGGESGVVIEGGTMQFAPGTSAGGNSGADIKNVEVITD